MNSKQKLKQKKKEYLKNLLVEKQDAISENVKLDVNENKEQEKVNRFIKINNRIVLVYKKS